MTLWTDDAELARSADYAGIDRIGPDLETLGKAKRQKGLPTWITDHRIERLPSVRDAISRAGLFVRTNPLHENSRDEVGRLLDMGAEILMLPNFTTASEVERYLDLVKGRAKVVPLLERFTAFEDLDRLTSFGEIDEIHVGLNDLSIDLGISNRLALLASDMIAGIAVSVLAKGLRFGIGGIARAGDDKLLIPSDLVYAQYARLGARAALISRSFQAGALAPDNLRDEITKAKARMREWFSADAAELGRSRQALQALAALETSDSSAGSSADR